MGIRIRMCDKKTWIDPFVVAPREPRLRSCWRIQAVLPLSFCVDMYHASYLVALEIGHNSVVRCYWLVWLRQQLMLGEVQTPNAPFSAAQKC